VAPSLSPAWRRIQSHDEPGPQRARRDNTLLDCWTAGLMGCWAAGLSPPIWAQWGIGHGRMAAKMQISASRAADHPQFRRRILPERRPVGTHFEAGQANHRRAKSQASSRFRPTRSICPANSTCGYLYLSVGRGPAARHCNFVQPGSRWTSACRTTASGTNNNQPK
jgi:hypothetical protein